MKNLRIFAVAALVCVAASTAALAHALLERAVPGVGATVSASPHELELAFSENIVAAFSGASLATAEGGAVPAGKASVNPGAPTVLHVPLPQQLAPGVYVVNWHVVSTDTHRSSGHYKFTVAP